MKNVAVGIDLGSSTTRVVVAEIIKGEKFPKVIGVGETIAEGFRHGYVINTKDAINSLKKAVEMAEKSADIKIKKASINICTSSLRGEASSGTTVISKADNEVTNLDVQKALEDCENNLNQSNKKIIHAFSNSYKLDGKEISGRVEGLHGTKLEVKTLYVTVSSQHLEDLLEIVTKNGITPYRVVASPISASNMVLSKKQKIVGSAVVDIGAETVSMGVFENDNLIALQSFAIGSEDITNDIALGLRVTLEEAEKYKLGDEDLNEKDKKQLKEIVSARLSDIFELIDNHLKKIKRNELLPAGIIFIGGGANIKELETLAKDALKLPTKIASTEMFGNAKTKLKDPAWFSTLGLLDYNEENDTYTNDSLPDVLTSTKKAITNMLRQLLP